MSVIHAEALSKRFRSTHVLKGVDLDVKEFGLLGYVSENQEMPEWTTIGYYLEFLRPFTHRGTGSWKKSWSASLICRATVSCGIFRVVCG
jgi:hypothetical protein